MKFAGALLFFGVFGVGWLFFRAKTIATAAIEAAKRLEQSAIGARINRDVSQAQAQQALPEGIREVQDIAQYAAKIVEAIWEPAKQPVFEYSFWCQERLSGIYPGAVRPGDLRNDQERLRVAAYFAGALSEMGAESFQLTDEATCEKVFRKTLRTILGADLGAIAAESAYKFLSEGCPTQDLAYAHGQGQLDMLGFKRGEVRPFDSRFRDAVIY